MVHVKQQVQFLPISLATAWDFFSRPENLNRITPPDIHFVIRSVLPEKVHAGLLITYNLIVFKGLPFKWVTEITEVEEPVFFIDEQRKGPYKLWHHEHYFKEVPGGVEMTDIVHYELPLGWLGNLFHGVLVRPRLTKIFDYRRCVLEEIFGKAAS